MVRSVHQKMLEDANPSDVHERECETASDEWHEPSLEDEVTVMDAIRRKNELRGERMNRRIRECMAKGMSSHDAFDLAWREVMPRESTGDSSRLEEVSRFDEVDCEVEESWQPELQSDPFDESGETEFEERHPAVVKAQDFLHDVMELAGTEAMPDPFLDTLSRGALDMVGGLVQATFRELDHPVARALAITQLKRALQGHAFSRGAVFGLRASDSISDERSSHMLERLDVLLDVIHQLSSLAWDE